MLSDGLYVAGREYPFQLMLLGMQVDDAVSCFISSIGWPLSKRASLSVFPIWRMRRHEPCRDVFNSSSGGVSCSQCARVHLPECFISEQSGLELSFS